MYIVGINAGYFNPTIFIILVITGTVQMLIGVVIKQIYLRKYEVFGYEKSKFVLSNS